MRASSLALYPSARGGAIMLSISIYMYIYMGRGTRCSA